MLLAHDTVTPDIETSSAEYSSRFSGEVGEFFLETQSRLVGELIRTLPKLDSILELGAGHGQLAPTLKRSSRFLCLQGSDPQCAKNVRAYNFVSSRLWALPFADKSFDLVVAVRLLAHVEDWQKQLTEMTRVAKLGVLIDYPSLSALNLLSPLFFGVKRKIEGNTRPYFSYSHGQLRSFLDSLGFEVTVRNQFFIPMGIHRKLRSPRISKTLEGNARTLGLTRLFGSPTILLALRRNTP